MRIHKITWRTTPDSQFPQSVHIDLDEVVSISEPKIKAHYENKSYYLGSEFHITLRHCDKPIVIDSKDTDGSDWLDGLFDNDVMRVPVSHAAILSAFVRVYEAWTGTIYIP